MLGLIVKTIFIRILGMIAFLLILTFNGCSNLNHSTKPLSTPNQKDHYLYGCYEGLAKAFPRTSEAIIAGFCQDLLYQKNNRQQYQLDKSKGNPI